MALRLFDGRNGVADSVTFTLADPFKSILGPLAFNSTGKPINVAGSVRIDGPVAVGVRDFQVYPEIDGASIPSNPAQPATQDYEVRYRRSSESVETEIVLAFDVTMNLGAGSHTFELFGNIVAGVDPWVITERNVTIAEFLVP